jgi:hypothetical protein
VSLPVGLSSTHRIAKRLLAGPRVPFKRVCCKTDLGNSCHGSSRFSRRRWRTVLKTRKCRLRQNSGYVRSPLILPSSSRPSRLRRIPTVV